MKLFIVALIVLALILALCFLGPIVGSKMIDGLMKTLDESKGASGNVPENAERICEILNQKWADSRFLLSMLLPHHHLDDVNEKLVKLSAYSKTEDFDEWQCSVFELRERLEHIHGLVGINADNIL